MDCEANSMYHRLVRIGINTELANRAACVYMEATIKTTFMCRDGACVGKRNILPTLTT